MAFDCMEFVIFSDWPCSSSPCAADLTCEHTSVRSFICVCRDESNCQSSALNTNIILIIVLIFAAVCVVTVALYCTRDRRSSCDEQTEADCTSTNGTSVTKLDSSSVSKMTVSSVHSLTSDLSEGGCHKSVVDVEWRGHPIVT